ncbi:hypothetical protein AVDCRST_MAG94-7080 [uncultured Leptolyngbya sp.]|uniref:Uncharacterized protein n=1 Tax=uncultured Leptolyngbya sp. TaxID=332963 RepID=A0A6J4PXI9_9CYAN|nr:hypothetical protein AVDCRST_MAG94-7080 [uncultured Leptolyngbya sp.]
MQRTDNILLDDICISRRLSTRPKITARSARFYNGIVQSVSSVARSTAIFIWL